MKVSELIDILKQYDPSEEVVMAAKTYQMPASTPYSRSLQYFHFVINKHKGQLGAKGSSNIVAIEMTEEIVGYFKPFIKLKQ
jgi:hypothetical protein